MSNQHCEEIFEAMVESVGIKAFAANMGISTRQVHRMLNGAQPNPLDRFCRTMKSCDGKAAEQALSHVCRQSGVYWIRVPVSMKAANLDAVKEAAQAIVAITEDRSITVEVREIREAIAALAALEKKLDQEQATAKAPRHGTVHTDLRSAPIREGAPTEEAPHPKNPPAI